MARQDVVLITGGLNGIGFELTKIFAKNGYRVYASSRHIKNFDKTSLDGNYDVRPVEIDLLVPDTAQKAVQHILKESKHMDILINNAASGYYSSVEEIDTEIFLKQLQLNVLGTVLMTKLVLPSMREQRKGKIINISSILGFSTAALNAPYSACKYAIESISETLAFEVKPFGIDVILIQPGDFHTDFVKNAAIAKYDEDSPYFKLYRRMQKNINSYQKGRDPKDLAVKIYKISQCDKPALRYMVGKEVLIRKVLHTLLYDKLWVAFMRRYYKW